VARDKFHDLFRKALENEGWNVTHDPLRLKTGRIPVLIDLGAERILAAEKGEEKVAIEIKTFGNPSFITAFYEAVGKYIVYKEAIQILEPNRLLYLALPDDVYEGFAEDLLIDSVFQRHQFRIVTYDSEHQIIVKWIR
jgi:hypothetical protein